MSASGEGRRGRIAGLVLAAGPGRRFGAGIKQLAPLEGRPLLQHAIDAQLAAPSVERLVIVLGAHASAIRRRIEPGRAEIVLCPTWQEGRSAALLAGLGALEGSDRILCTLGDQPWVTAAVIERMAGQDEGARAGYGARPGHPVVLGPRLHAAIRSLRGDTGARPLLRRAPLIECGDIGSDRDVDTQADLTWLLANAFDGRSPSVSSASVT